MALEWCEDAASYVKELTSEGKPDVDYVLFHLANPKRKPPFMELFSMGKGGRSKVVEELLPATDKVITGAFLASAIDERGSVVSVRRKYVHVIWVGPQVGIMVKGKVNTSLTQPFKDLFPGCALYIQMSDGDTEELESDHLQQTLLTSGGGDVTRYSFTNRTLIGSLCLDDSSYNQSSSSRREPPQRIAAPKKTLKKTAQELAMAEEEEARRRAAEVARRKAAVEQETRLAAEEEARRRHEEEERQKRARDAQRQAEEEEHARKAQELEAQQKAAAAAAAEEEEARRKAAEEEAAAAAEIARQAAISMTPKTALGDKTMIMLISSMSGNMTTSTNQALARRMLKEVEVEPEVIDGAVPENKDIRNELFSISGLRGVYPLFFLRQSDGNLKFFGDFEALQHYNETGTLAQQIGGSATPRRASATSLNSSNHASAFPDGGSTLNGSKLLLLISSMSGSMEVSANQNRAETILRGLHLPPNEIEILDGCDPSVKDRRNELFNISGIRAKYPQLFLITADDKTNFVGNFDDLSYLHDTNTLGQAIGLESKAPSPVTLSTLNGKKLLLLISSMSGSLEVTANQNRAEVILKGLHLSPEEIELMDGCDAGVKEKRNELFSISGIRAKYPQLFLVDGKDGSTQFVGNFDDISYLHDTNTLAQAIGLVSKVAADGNGGDGISAIRSISAPSVEPQTTPETEISSTKELSIPLGDLGKQETTEPASSSPPVDESLYAEPVVESTTLEVEIGLLRNGESAQEPLHVQTPADNTVEKERVPEVLSVTDENNEEERLAEEKQLAETSDSNAQLISSKNTDKSADEVPPSKEGIAEAENTAEEQQPVNTSITCPVDDNVTGAPPATTEQVVRGENVPDAQASSVAENEEGEVKALPENLPSPAVAT